LKITQPEEAPTKRLGDVAEFFAGASLPPGEAFTGQAGGHLLMKVSDMNLPGNEIQIVRSANWSPAAGARSATCPSASIVIPKRGGAIGTNKKRLTTRSTILDPNLMAIKPGPQLSLRYLLEWFLGFDLASITSGSSVPQLNKQDLAPLNIPVPEPETQDHFAYVAKSVDQVAAKMRLEVDYTEKLFLALQSRAFAGQL
jgi:type I restriction enzyme S subunit